MFHQISNGDAEKEIEQINPGYERNFTARERKIWLYLAQMVGFYIKGLTGRSHAERGSVKKEKYQGLGEDQ